jgi:ligand-binding sensor domain-containing protein/signal transduction histidine kinase
MWRLNRTRISACVALAMLLSPVTHAERLAVKRYTTADGLPGDFIIHMTRDSRGFLWFATRDGLSRFDGVRFTSYGMVDGLPASTINHLLETRNGEYLISTNGGGVCRFNPSGRRGRAPAGPDALFVCFRVGTEPTTNRVNIAYEDRSGRLWAGTDDGIFRGERDGDRLAFQRVDLAYMPDDRSQRAIFSLTDADDGSLWIGGGWGVTRRLPDSRDVVYRPEEGGTRDFVDALRMDGARLWAGTRSGLLRLDPAPIASYTSLPSPIMRRLDRTSRRPPAPDELAVWFTTADGLPHDTIGAVLFSGGRMWIGTGAGLSEYDGRTFRTRGAANGLPDSHVTDLVEDTAGNLWMSSVTGATRLIRNGLVTFNDADGLPNVRIHSLSEDADGRLFAVGVDYRVSQLEGARFVSTRPGVPRAALCTWMSRCGYVDRAGDWWITSPAGLFRWTKPARVGDLASRAPQAVYTSRSGLPEDNIFSAFEDTRGHLWVSTASGGLLEWDRARERWREYGEADGLPPLKRLVTPATTFAEDRSGGLWIGFEQGGGLVRRRGDRFERFTPEQGAPPGTITALHVDAAGRLWIGSNQAGLRRVDHPGADRPVFTAFTIERGLASDNVRALTEDARGRIYAGTSRGVDRIDPTSGAVRHFSVGEGLASDFVTAALRDRTGALWFATMIGLSRLDPSADAGPPPPAPPVFIASLRAGATPVPISELGDAAPPPLTLAPDQNLLEIGYYGFSFESGEPLKYQYRLEGASREWSVPTDVRTVNFARLASGSYRFVVRAVRPDGTASTTPAAVEFTVLPPYYRTWWFITLAILALGALGLMLYRARVAQLLRVERVRSRIATDLHDDIGASLSQIAILAEVARQRVRPLVNDQSDPDATAPLARIAETSRSLVDSMSDIVWAINPEVDSLSDLVHRMRRFVEDTLGTADIELTFRAPDPSQDVKLGADVRREVFLVLKESVTNIAKHAHATRVAIDLQIDRRRLHLRVADNGRGFDPGASTEGNGVASMRRRVEALGGHLVIDSRPGAGTTISFDIEVTA